jgi:O-antigen ligase
MTTVFSFRSLLGRFEVWQAMMAALKDHPLTGLGLGGWWSEVSEFSMSRAPHNAYLQLYADTGALGIIALVLAAVIGIRLLWRILHSDKRSPYYGVAAGIAAGMIAGGVHALVDMNLNILILAKSKSIYFAVPLLWLWAAWLVVSYHHLVGSEAPESKHPPPDDNLSERTIR